MTERDDDGADVQPPIKEWKPDPVADERDRVVKRRMLKQASKTSFIGIEFGVSAAIGYFLGDALDDWLQTHPWFTITMVLFGLASASRSLIKMVMRTDLDRADDDEPPPT